MVAALPIALALLAPALARPTPGEPTVVISVTYVPAAEPGEIIGRLRIELVARDLDKRAARAEWVLEDWGNLSSGDFEYVAKVEAEPPLLEADPAGRPNTFRFDPPRHWDRSLRLAYELPVFALDSPQHGRRGLAPCGSESYAFAFFHNTVPRLRLDGERLPARHTLVLQGPADWTVFSGWAGASPERQEIELERDDDQAMFTFGRPVAIAGTEVDGLPVEVAQFGSREPVAEVVLEALAKLVASYSEATGVPALAPVRVFLNEASGGGTRTDHGLQVGFMADSEPGRERSPYFLNTLAHELFHDWLPGRLELEGSLVWFFEGFTDYAALWHLARTELVSREWFAQRMLELELEVRERSAVGQVSFADPDVGWRDGDGPIETLAYKGGAVLALALDAELRRKRKGGLMDLLRELIEDEGGRVSLERLRRVIRKRGLKDFHEQHVEGTTLPDVGETLEGVGFRPRKGDGEGPRYRAGGRELERFFD